MDSISLQKSGSCEKHFNYLGILKGILKYIVFQDLLF